MAETLNTTFVTEIILNLPEFSHSAEFYTKMFGGTLRKYTGSNYTIELKEDVRPFPIPNIYKPTLKKEVHRLI